MMEFLKLFVLFILLECSQLHPLQARYRSTNSTDSDFCRRHCSSPKRFDLHLYKSCQKQCMMTSLARCRTSFTVFIPNIFICSKRLAPICFTRDNGLSFEAITSKCVLCNRIAESFPNTNVRQVSCSKCAQNNVTFHGSFCSL